MIGLGVWEIPVNSMFYKGCAEITVKNDGGNYDFEFFLPGFKVPKMDIFNVQTSGNTLSADATCDMLKGKKISVSVSFDGDTCRGVAKGPYGIKININGRKKA